ncbi:MAG: S8 family serine peptidase, partial [Candidatus Thalassarchaeaceae archaeon]|nr:S8 family serine peptidase [Candidatus Thalassarchaeaceae archaeon]
MEKQVSVFILIVLLSSTLSLPNQDAPLSEDNREELSTEINRIEISLDPHTVRDLGMPAISVGEEGQRGLWADASIGTYTSSGLILNSDIPPSMMAPRSDLIMVLISPSIGLWDARVSILESAQVAIRTTIPPSGFLIQGTGEELNSVTSLPFVEASHHVPVALIVEDRLWEQQSTTEVELIGWKDEELVRLDSPGVGLDGSVSRIAQNHLEEEWSPSVGIHFGNLHPNSIQAIAMNPEVAFLSTTPDLSTWNNLASSHMEANSVESYFFTGLNGSGQRVAVADSGIDHDHGDFGSRIVQRIDVANDGSTADPSDGHGTHVACTVLGSGSRTSTYEGIAPQAELYLQAMEDDDSGALSGPGVYSLLNSAYSSGGARIHTNSWGSWNSGGDYSTQSEDADDRTSTWDQYWAYDGMTVLFAAGNDGDEGANSISPPGTAKNVITVGAHVNRYSSNAADQMYLYSSKGPTDDGRIKPDIVAAGDYVRSCRAQEATEAPDNLNDQWYLEYSGTSMATPAAAGASALIREYLMEIAERPEPQGALVKAMLILGAEDMGTRDIPNNDEGWGRLNLVNTLLPDSDVGIFVDDRSRLSSGQEASYNFDVTRSGEPLKVVLTWSDYPGSTFSTTQLRNDLNLEVTSPDGTVTYLGNDFANGRSTTGGEKDDKNNVEVVLIDSASTGVWNVKVKDFSHGGSRNYQPFAIAVRGVNVNDLTPDPAIVPSSFQISTPIPQVGEPTSFSVSVINQGSGSFAEAFVSAHINGDPQETKSLGMSPGEEVILEWDWTPGTSDKGETEIRIEVDPGGQLEELYEDNNLLIENIDVSAPGIQASTETYWKTLDDASDTTTKWEIVMTNLALFDTNASIEVTKPVRKVDGAEFDWFKSFDK